MGKGHSKARSGVRPSDSWQRHAVMPPSESDKAAADRLRLEGNQMFQKGKYGAALEARHHEIRHRSTMQRPCDACRQPVLLAWTLVCQS